MRRTLQELERKIAPQFQGNLRRVMYGLEDLLNSYDGEENLIGHVLDNDGMKAVYLESQGKHIDEVQVEQEVPKRFNQAAKDKYEAIIAALGTRDLAEIGTMPLKDIRDNYGTELEKIVPGISKTALRLSRFMQQTIDYLMDDGSGPETEMVVDQNATRRAMEDALDREGYEAWVRELFSGIEGDKGIYNGKERFTPSGRSRSFQQTHLPVTLDNIVKAMAAQNGGNTKNVAGFNGVKTLRAGTAQRFKSIQGMHDLEGRLQNLTEEEQTALTDGLQSRLYDLIDEIDQEAGRKGTSNNLIRFDQIGQIITEASETGRYNVADIQKVFQENHHEISDELAMKVKELLFDVSQMPVNLFEAKPRRAVRFDEVRAAVVPADTSKELKRKLEEQGVPVIEYERDNTDDRMRKVNSVEGVKFSERDPAAQKLNRALEKENAAQAQEIQYLRELVKLQGQVTNGTKFTRSSVRTLAQQLMKDAGAKGNYLELSEKLNGIYESIAAQDDPLGMSWGEVEGRIDEAARWLVEHIEVKQDRGEYANDILRDLRGRKISLNDGQRAEVEGRYGSYDTFRKSMFGSVTISKDGTPLDMVWQELAGQYPGTFDADIGDADMALELADVVARLRETDVAAMEFEMQRDGLLEDLRQKVYDGYWEVSTLHTVADKWQKKVDALKQQHQDTMEKLDKARQERDAANADRIDSVKKVREQKNEAVKKVRQQYQESKKKSVEGRRKTEMRHKIQRVVKELNDLLLKPDKKHHVPEGLRKAVAEALDMVNMERSDTAERVARYDELIAKETDQEKIDAYEVARQTILDRAGNVRSRLDALRAAYEEIRNSADPEIANAYDANISECLLELSGTIGDTSVYDMSMDQLSDVYDTNNTAPMCGAMVKVAGSSGTVVEKGNITANSAEGGGADGITPHIGSDGNWYIGTTDTGVKAQGTDGAPGDPGRGIASVERTSGNGAAGTVDTYTITYTDGTTSTYQVRNGADGKDATIETQVWTFTMTDGSVVEMEVAARAVQ